MKPFFQVQSLEQVLSQAQELPALPSEELDLIEAAGRTLAAELLAPHDLPGFPRATMDGFAVISADTFGASESIPGYLGLAGEVRMGQAPGFSLAPGQCARIGTGGMLPMGADAVVMVEHTRYLDQQTVEIGRPVAPGTNILGPRDDAAQGQLLLPAGQSLRPQDIGLLAALGQAKVRVFRRPRVAVISTGDEVMPITSQPGPGQVRDVNTYSLCAALAAAGADPLPLGLVADDPDALCATVAQALQNCDLLLLSGGSSVGGRDLTAQIFLSLPQAELLVHGVAVAPGKPFIWARAAGCQLLGLPGQVASCLVAYHLFAEPMIERLLGRPATPFTRFGRQQALLTRNLPSASGRQEYLRVKLALNPEGGWLAQPVLGKSGLLRTLIEADGLVDIPRDAEGIPAGRQVTVLTFPRT